MAARIFLHFFDISRPANIEESLDRGERSVI